MIPAYDSIFILGGHKLAASYFEKLNRAQKDGVIAFKHLSCVTPDPKAAIHEIAHPSQIIFLDNASFLQQLAERQTGNPNDVLVPDHTAKHVLLQTYLQIVATQFQNMTANLCAIKSDFQTPFVYKSENDALWAVSYATWTCAPDCNEPAICPHTTQKRSWDFNNSLNSLYAELAVQNVICHDFACEPLFAEICHLPVMHIQKQILAFQKELKNLAGEKIFLIATHSHCHGILGQFRAFSER